MNKWRIPVKENSQKLAEYLMAKYLQVTSTYHADSLLSTDVPNFSFKFQKLMKPESYLIKS